MARINIKYTRDREGRQRVKIHRCLWPIFLLCFGSPYGAESAGQAPLTVGILPAFSTEQLIATFEPLVDALAATTGISLRIETAPTMAEFARRTLVDRRYDVLLTAPHLYVDAARRGGYRLLVRVNADALRVLVVVRNSSPLQRIEELAAKRVATMEPIALISVQGSAMLREVGLDPEQDVNLIIVPNMDAAVQTVLRQHADAAFVINTYFEKRMRPDVRKQFRILSASEVLPHLPISAAPWVDEAIAKRLTAALTALHSDREGAFVLHKLGWRGFSLGSAEDYAAAEKLLNAMRSSVP